MSAQPEIHSDEQLEAFRRDTRQWLEANCPAEMRQPVVDESDVCWGGRAREVQERCAARLAGTHGAAWLDGAGMAEGLRRRRTEQGRSKSAARGDGALRCRSPLTSFGISMLGPALLKYGNEAQKREHIPKIVRGEIRWCQGYSEPGAGSDLASLKTRADDKGDHFLINGSKIWTSYGDKADWIFCLVRTNFEGKKHDGISFLLFDMASPGISTRPIRLISGYSPFTQTFFDNVKVPKENLLGELNKGWTIAKYLLTHERNMIGGMGLGLRVGGKGSLGQLAVANLGLAGGRLADRGAARRYRAVRDRCAGIRADDGARAGRSEGRQ